MTASSTSGDGREHQPSTGLLVAAMLARAGWTPPRLARGFGLPLAFAEALYDDAIATGERRPGDDVRLARAFANLRARRQQPSTGMTSKPPDGAPPAGAASGRGPDRAGDGSGLVVGPRKSPPRRHPRGPWLWFVLAAGCLLGTIAFAASGRHPAGIDLVLLGLSVLCWTAVVAHARRLNRRRPGH